MKEIDEFDRYINFDYFKLVDMNWQKDKYDSLSFAKNQELDYKPSKEVKIWKKRVEYFYDEILSND